MPRLKVFHAPMGFFEAVVAAPSQKAALEAWGTRQDLFGEGLAKVIDDGAAVKAALAQPGVVLRRAAGSKGAYSAEATPPKAPPTPRRPAAKAKPPSPAAKKPPKPDRSELTAAEKALAAADADHRSQAAALQRERKALEARERDLEAGFGARRRALKRTEDKARRAFERAGG